MDSSVILVSSVDAQGEHFFIMQPPDERGLAKAMTSVPKFSSGAEAKAWARDRWEQYFQSQSALTEADARQALAQYGLDAGDVEQKIANARRGREWARQTDFDWLTQLGHRNVHGQVVVRKTDASGTKPFQRVYVIGCDLCGHEYGTNGCDTHICHCPVCQNGSPGIPY